jgi:hypothetical protein
MAVTASQMLMSQKDRGKFMASLATHRFDVRNGSID